MCCNGTLFTYVTLVPDDLAKLRKYSQLKLVTRNEQDTFDEPCPLHTGTHCSAYADRPDTCSRYVCGVLRSVARDEMSENEAESIIREGRALVDNVKACADFEATVPLAVSAWEAVPAHLTTESKVAWERTAFHLRKYFLGTLNEHVEGEGAAAPLSGSPDREPRARPPAHPRRE
jgi:Fe-S-cluster containining protein